MNEDELQEILTIFKSESEEHLEKLNEGVLRLERDPFCREVIEEVFREAHSLKGAARMIGFEEIERIAHGIEDIFNEAKKENVSFGPAVADLVLEGLDLVNRAVSLKLRGKGEGSVDVADYCARQRTLLQELLSSAARGRDEARVAEPKQVETPSVPGEPEVSVEPEVFEETGTIEPPPEAAGVASAREPAPLDNEGFSLSLGMRGSIRRDIERAEELSRNKRGTDEEPGGQTRQGKHVEETIRVSIDKLDDLMAQVGETLVAKIRSDQRLMEVRDLLGICGTLHREWHRQVRHTARGNSFHEGKARSIIDFLSSYAGLIEDLQERMTRLGDSMAEENLRLDLISGNLQESVNRIRMLPMSAIFNFFPRLVRDISRDQGKEVELIIVGADTRLDKRILEELKDPLTHLVRNSIDHGLEVREEREAAGKPPVGKLVLSALQKGNNVLVELEDDGQGIDPERIKEIAVKRSFISEEALKEMTPSQVIQIIFQPGFTSKEIITDVSGRGVGLDVVLTNIERLKGKLSTHSIPGRGTRFSIKLPLTLATTQALLIRAGGERYAIPLTAVEYTGEVGLEEISMVEGRETVLVNEQPINVIRLAEVLELPETELAENNGKIPLAVLSSTDDRVAFALDDFMGEQEVVVKTLGHHLERVPNVAGATLLADGTPVMILNVFDLIKNARKARGLWVSEKMKDRNTKRKRFTIMVVDDSITTRTLEKNILESNGYRVVTAVDGQEALEKIKAGKVDLVVSDVQMPRMDGFRLSEVLKSEPKFQGIPVILVTSLESEDDKRRGIDVGADAYITKGAFDQGNLLNTIRQLL